MYSGTFKQGHIGTRFLSSLRGCTYFRGIVDILYLGPQKGPLNGGKFYCVLIGSVLY